jgi:BspA type Leucine rich repeat region (6 copies)
MEQFGRSGQYQIPAGVTSVQPGAFAFCTHLTNIDIPSSTTNLAPALGNGPFSGCTSLVNITVDPSNGAYRSLEGVLFDRNQGTLLQFPCGRTGSYDVPIGVTSIGAGAFDYCYGLAAVTLPIGLTNIADYAFAFCAAIGQLVIPNGVTHIGNNAFLACTSLGAITIPDTVISLGFSAFFRCSALFDLTLPDGITTIEASTFDGCSSLTSLQIPSRVTSIGPAAFQSSGLRTVSMPNGLGSIQDFTFSGCWALTNVTIPGGVTNIGNSAFADCGSLNSLFFEGTAPACDGSAFTGDNGTAFYLAGNVGWGTNLCGLQTAVWALPAPTILGSGPSFGPSPNGFGFQISWATNALVVVEATTNLATASWSPVATNIFAGGSSQFRDPDGAKFPTRFYRLRWD